MSRRALIGVLGGFTTFSAFGLETMFLLRRGEPWTAALYVVASVLLGLVALALSLILCAVNVRFRDVSVAMPLLLQIGMFASPVVYPLEAVPAKQQESARLAQPARVPDAVAIQSPSGRSARPDVSELKLRIREMRESGMTLQAIANRLNEENVPTLRGGARWRPSAVQAASGDRRPSQRSQRERRPSSSRKGGGAR